MKVTITTSDIVTLSCLRPPSGDARLARELKTLISEAETQPFPVTTGDLMTGLAMRTRAQILQQAASAIMTQGNGQPTDVLTLLR